MWKTSVLISLLLILCTVRHFGISEKTRSWFLVSLDLNLGFAIYIALKFTCLSLGFLNVVMIIITL